MNMEDFNMDNGSMKCYNCQISTTDLFPELYPYQNGSHDYTLTSQDQSYQLVGMILHRYVTPTDVFVGLVANVVSILVFAGKELRKLSSSVYVLSVLAADTGTLLTMLFVWLETLGHNITHRYGMCQVFVYFQYVSSFLSVWYMVCITVENYITICHPLRIRSLCTLYRARFVAISLAVGALLLYLFLVFANDIMKHPNFPDKPPVCSLKGEWSWFMTIMSYVDSILTLLIPSVAMIVMLGAIVVAIVHSLRQKRKRTVRENHRSANCPQVRVAKMLFALSSTYLLLNIPSHVIRLYFLLKPREPNMPDMTFRQGFIQLIFLHISYINSYLKFFLFFGFSANFRKGILGGCCRLFPRCRVYAPVAMTTEGTKV